MLHGAISRSCMFLARVGDRCPTMGQPACCADELPGESSGLPPILVWALLHPVDV
jgi:hypothetical protein